MMYTIYNKVSNVVIIEKFLALISMSLHQLY